MELAEFSFNLQYWQGNSNFLPDSFTHAHHMAVANNLVDIHPQLCHPGVARLQHFVESKNLPHSIE